jgi:hypothetical protein
MTSIDDDLPVKTALLSVSEPESESQIEKRASGALDDFDEDDDTHIDESRDDSDTEEGLDLKLDPASPMKINAQSDGFEICEITVGENNEVVESVVPMNESTSLENQPAHQPPQPFTITPESTESANDQSQPLLLPQQQHHQQQPQQRNNRMPATPNEPPAVSRRTSSVAGCPIPEPLRGMLNKMATGYFKNWDKRFFQLERGALIYFEPVHWYLKGQFDLLGQEVAPECETAKNNYIKLCSADRPVIWLEAETPEEKKKWIFALKEHIAFTNHVSVQIQRSMMMETPNQEANNRRKTGKRGGKTGTAC